MDPLHNWPMLTKLRAALVVLALSAFLLYTCFTAFGFVLHYYDRANKPSLPQPPQLGPYIRAFGREWWFGLVLLVTYPFGWLPPLRPKRYNRYAGPPVIIVPGLMQNHASLLALYHHLMQCGLRNVFLVNPQPLFGPIETISERIGLQIAQISQACEGARVVAVGHSMGGIILRWCAQNQPDLPLEKIITLGTPHRGSRVAAFGRAANTVQLRPGSPLLAELAGQDRLPVISFYTQYDNFVLPPDSSNYGDATRTFDHCGHCSLLYDRQVLNAVAAAITDPVPRTAAEPATPPDAPSAT